jgi:hypothetical protein
LETDRCIRTNSSFANGITFKLIAITILFGNTIDARRIEARATLRVTVLIVGNKRRRSTEARRFKLAAIVGATRA